MDESTAISPSGQACSRRTGARHVNLIMRAHLDQADRFIGSPLGTVKRFRLLAAFKEAEPYLGLPAHAYKLLDWLIQLTQDQDWEKGNRPIAGPQRAASRSILACRGRA